MASNVSTTSVVAASSIFIWFVVGFGAIGGVLFGMDQANFAGVETKKSFIDDFCNTDARGHYGNYSECEGLNQIAVPTGWSSFEAWGSSLVQLGAAAGALLLAPTITRREGRRAGLCCGCVVVLLAMIWTIMTINVMSFYFSRFVTGIGVGMVTFTLPIWTAELAPKHIRGVLGCTMQLAVVIGSQIAAGINIPDNVSWRESLGAPIVPAAIVIIFIFFFPESPRFLLQTKGAIEARSILVKLRGTENVNDEMDEIQQAIEQEKNEAPWHVLWTDPSIRRRLIISNMLQWMQQFTGINALLGQGPKLFLAAGVPLHANTAGFISSSFNLVGTVVMMFIIDRKGRRPLLLMGGFGMLFFMLTAGFIDYFYLPDSVHKYAAGWGLLISVCLYFFSFAIAWGGIPWVYPSEIFPMDVKEKAISTSVCSQWLANFLIAQVTPRQIDSWGVSATFFFYSVFIAASIVFVYFFIPEIKGLSMEEMDGIFGERKYQTAHVFNEDDKAKVYIKV